MPKSTKAIKPNVAESKPNTGRWLRLYADVVNDPKVQRLEPRLFKAWINCLCIASTADGRLDVEELPFRLRISDTDADGIVCELLRAGLLEYAMIAGDRCLSPHNWEKRQPKHDSSKLRMRKLREQKVTQKSDTLSTGDASRDGKVRISSPLSTPEYVERVVIYQEGKIGAEGDDGGWLGDGNWEGGAQ